MSILRRGFVRSPLRMRAIVRVSHGAIIRRHGRAWVGGELVEVTPEDAKRLERSGAAERVRMWR